MTSPATTLLVATGNAGKLREIRALLAHRDLVVKAWSEVGPVDFPHEGVDYRENAIAKARAVATALGEAALGDDSGLEVDALGGAPGPLSARYGGPGLDDAGRIATLLDALRDTEERRARFVCEAAIVAPDGAVWHARGECEGRILTAPTGTGGFGYDPIFQPEGHPVSMAELPPDEKDSLSHRGRALRALLAKWPPAGEKRQRAVRR